MVYSGAWEKLIHEKNQKSKISWHCPFNLCISSEKSPLSLVNKLRSVLSQKVSYRLLKVLYIFDKIRVCHTDRTNCAGNYANNIGLISHYITVRDVFEKQCRD